MQLPGCLLPLLLLPSMQRLCLQHHHTPRLCWPSMLFMQANVSRTLRKVLQTCTAA
jgi:hypothetical protein